MSPRAKRSLIWVGAVLGTLIVLRVVAALIWPTINDVRTGGTLEYPDLVAQRFARPADEVFAAALATAKDMEFEIVQASAAQPATGGGVIWAVATTRVFRFKDDVTITITREANATVVNVRSKSRIGKGDLGANARRIHDFQHRLGARLET